MKRSLSARSSLPMGSVLAVDMSPGRLAVILRGDPWLVRLPRLWGNYHFVAVHTEVPKGYFNVLEAVDGMSKEMQSALTLRERSHLSDAFRVAFEAFRYLGEEKSELHRAARVDLISAADQIMMGSAGYPLACWSALQATEKTIKQLIATLGGEFPHSHNLSSLARLAVSCGSCDFDNANLARIQCTPAIRYGEEPAPLERATAAQEAALTEIARIAAARIT